MVRAAHKDPEVNNRAASSTASRYRFTLFSNNKHAESHPSSDPSSSTAERQGSSGPEEPSDAEAEHPASEPSIEDGSDLELDEDTPKATRNLKHIIKLMHFDVRAKT